MKNFLHIDQINETGELWMMILLWIFILATAALALVLIVSYATRRTKQSIKAEDTFLSLMETLPNMLAVVDELNCVLYISRQLASFAHISRPDICIGRPILDLFGDMNVKLMIGGILKTKSYFEDEKEINVDGEERYFKIISDVMVGKSRGTFIHIIDITQLVETRLEAEKANRAKSEFLATMSHEIRTPMNAILGLNEVLSKMDMTVTQHKHLGDIRKSAQSLLAIINDILDFSKIEAGKLEIIESNYNLLALLDNLKSMFTSLFESKELDFNMYIDEELPHTVLGDENRVRQILTNLLSNALKYTQNGGVDFNSSLMRTENGSFLKFVVKDSGIGIKPEDTDKLFQPFEQLDIRRNRNVVGTGLGLAISYRLCKILGGDIQLSSTYGQGSTFTVTIPYKLASENIEEIQVEELKGFSANEARILVVDDIDINLEVCAAMLESFAIKPDLASSGAEALQLAHNSLNNNKPYQLVFMDHMMPGMDGIEATLQLRDMGGYLEIVPIIALTANVVNDAQNLFKANKFNGFLPKPIEFATLNKILREHLPPGFIKEF
ncbi:MAG: response regulator [Spirochaetaceae bacterium]|nr:response regulator [Spirochaetaceae bacterium]